MKKTIFKTGLFLVVALFAMSCSKDGVAGPAGANGANGINGTNGTNGNANVISINEFTIPPTGWLSSGNTKYYNYSSSFISQSILNSGIVIVYEKSSNGGWNALPYSSGGYDTRFNFGLNNLQIIVSTYNNTAFTFTGNTTYRFLVISSTNKMAGSNINWQNYEEVKSRFKLKD